MVIIDYILKIIIVHQYRKTVKLIVVGQISHVLPAGLLVFIATKYQVSKFHCARFIIYFSLFMLT
jgi:hypothetical protein